MEATVHFIHSELEDTIQHQVEDVLLCIDGKTRPLQGSNWEELWVIGGPDSQ
jgi:hypothetical protein